MDEESVQLGFIQYRKDRIWWNLSLILFAMLVHIWCFFYATTFCGVYPQSAVGLVYGVLWGLILNLGLILIIQPILLVMLRGIIFSCHFTGVDIPITLCDN